MRTADLFVFSDYNATATYNAIKGLLLRGVDRANEVFSGAEFYGRGTKIHKGISFKLAAYHIDTDQVKIVARLGHQNLYFGLVNSNLFFNALSGVSGWWLGERCPQKKFRVVLRD